MVPFSEQVITINFIELAGDQSNRNNTSISDARVATVKYCGGNKISTPTDVLTKVSYETVR